MALFPDFSNIFKDLSKNDCTFYYTNCFNRIFSSLEISFYEENKNPDLRYNLCNYYKDLRRKSINLPKNYFQISNVQKRIFDNYLLKTELHRHSKTSSISNISNFSDINKICDKMHTRQVTECNLIKKINSPIKQQVFTETEADSEDSKSENDLLEIILGKLKNFVTTNTFEENLFLADIIIRLMSIPTYVNSEDSLILHYLLVEPNENPIIKENSLLTILLELSHEFTKNIFSPAIPDLQPSKKSHIRTKTHSENLVNSSKKLVDVFFFQLVKF